MKDVVYNQLMELGFSNTEAETIMEAMDLEEED